MHNNEPTEVDYLSFLSEMHQTLESVEDFSFTDENHATLLGLHALLAHVVHLTKVGADLYAQGSYVPAFILARVALEHAVYAQLVSQHPSGFEGLIGLVTRSNAGAVKQAQAVLEVPMEILDALGESKTYEKVPEFTRFIHAVEAFSESDFLMLMYGNLSQFVHPSNSLFNTYLPDGFESSEVSLEPKVQNESRATHVMAFSLALALGAFDARTQSDQFAANIRTKAMKLGLQLMLKMKAKGENGEEI